MRLIITTTTKKTFFVKLPNYFDVSKIAEIVEKTKIKLPKGCTLTEYMLHSDAPTVEESQQLRQYGKILHPMVELLIFSPFDKTIYNL